ncbi:hypothetical protein [Pseudonocardia sp.]|uniref:hypothetical protein n=1 Tax=Pseudonocardia sp. TaxID=60912 RepID=UPI0031FE031C
MLPTHEADTSVPVGVAPTRTVPWQTPSAPAVQAERVVALLPPWRASPWIAVRQPVPAQEAATSAALSEANPFVADSHGPFAEQVEVATAVVVRARAPALPLLCVAASTAGSSVPVLVERVVVGQAPDAVRQSADTEAEVVPNRPAAVAPLPGWTATLEPVVMPAWQPPSWPVQLAAPREVERLTGSVPAPLLFAVFFAPACAARMAAALPPSGLAAAAESPVTVPVQALSGQSMVELA